MKEEIRRIEQEQKHKQKSEGYISDPESSEGKENEVRLDHSMHLPRSGSKTKKRGNSSFRNNSKKSLPFRSSAGFNKNREKDMVIKSNRRIPRAGSARKKLPPRSDLNKEKLNELKETKMTQEKDKIMSEYNQIYSKTTNSFKKVKPKLSQANFNI
jgi:hypothetical protein